MDLDIEMEDHRAASDRERGPGDWSRSTSARLYVAGGFDIEKHQSLVKTEMCSI